MAKKETPRLAEKSLGLPKYPYPMPEDVTRILDCHSDTGHYIDMFNAESKLICRMYEMQDNPLVEADKKATWIHQYKDAAYFYDNKSNVVATLDLDKDGKADPAQAEKQGLKLKV